MYNDCFLSHKSDFRSLFYLKVFLLQISPTTHFLSVLIQRSGSQCIQHQGVNSTLIHIYSGKLLTHAPMQSVSQAQTKSRSCLSAASCDCPALTPASDPGGNLTSSRREFGGKSQTSCFKLACLSLLNVTQNVIHRQKSLTPLQIARLGLERISACPMITFISPCLVGVVCARPHVDGLYVLASLRYVAFDERLL